MTMFPGAGAQVYYNEAGEPLGWDYPSEPDPDDFYDEEERPFRCKCGDDVWIDDVDELRNHYEVCTEPSWFKSKFGDYIKED